MKKMGLFEKLVGSYGIVALFTVFVGLVGWYVARDDAKSIEVFARERLPAVQSLLTLENGFNTIEKEHRVLLAAEQAQAEINLSFERLGQAVGLCEAQVANYSSLPQSGGAKDLWQAFTPLWQKFNQDNQQFLELCEALVENGILNPRALRLRLEQFKAEHYYLVGQVGNMLETEIEFEGHDDPAKSPFEKWRASRDEANQKVTELLDAMAEPNRAFYAAIKTIKQHIRRGDIDAASFTYEEKLLNATEKIAGQLDRLDQQAVIAEDFYHRMGVHETDIFLKSKNQAQAILKRLIAHKSQVASSEAETAVERAGQAQLIMIGGILTGFLFALIFGIGFSRSTCRIISRISDGLILTAEKVLLAAGQASSNSRALAQGASEQASAIEETAASLEQMSTITQKNADNANLSKDRVDQVSEIVNRLDGHMNQMSQAIEEIIKSSKATGKIIKTIDEIAFQTNLLALNAAVEAARAGEAGAGFAVVADEVRNLAQRAAEAARNTSALIDNTIQSVASGSEITASTREAFQENITIAASVGELMDEITTASREQAIGINQVNQAVGEMDKIVQQVAANASDSAASSQEMRIEAQQMSLAIGQLTALVRGSGTKLPGNISGGIDDDEPIARKKSPDNPPLLDM